MAERNERRSKRSHRKTYTAYLDGRVVDAIDTLVGLGRFANRSEAIEEGCKRLVVDITHEAVAGIEEREAA